MEHVKGADDAYWNSTENKSFNFDGDDGIGIDFPIRSDKLVLDDAASEASYEIQAPSGIALEKLISPADLQTILEEQSRNEPALPKTITPDEELKLLRREHQERLHAPSVDVTVTKMIIGKPCALELYKSARDKEDLLDEAVSSKVGTAILYVTLFLAKTLKKKLFYRILQVRPVALAYYVNYLKVKLQIAECMDLLVMLGRNHEAALIQFEALVESCSNPETKKNKLKRVYTDYFSQPGTAQFYSNFVATYTNLLEFQLSEKASGTAGSQNLPGVSVLQTLRYVLATHKWNETSDTPTKFADHYQILPAQFEWVALNERGRAQAWRDIEQLFERKSWHTLKSKSFQIHIPIEKAILQLHGLNAPVPVLNSFLGHVDDAQRRLMLAKKVGAVKAIVDALVALKDKPELEALKERLTAGTEERFYAENAVKNFGLSKWKPDGIKLGIR